MRRLLKLVAVSAAGALLIALPQGSYAAEPRPAANGPAVTIADIQDQELEIHPGLLDAKTTVVPLSVTPADAKVSIAATSSDKADVSLVDGGIAITPKAAGTLFVTVGAVSGKATATEIFKVGVVARTESGAYDWDGVVKVGGSGYVTGSVFSQIEPDVLYAKADIGGAYRYDFENDFWVGLNDDATDHSAAYAPGDPRGPGRGATFPISIMPDPVQKGRVYMAAGGSATNAAIYRSDDYGDTWQRFPIATYINGNDQSNRSTGERIAIDPKNNDIVYFASQQAGIWKSTNAGETFARITDAGDLAVNFRANFIAVDPNSPVDANGNSTRIIVSTVGAISQTPPTVAVDPMQQRPYKSLWVSQDGGGSFAEVAGQPDARTDRRYGGFVAEHFAWDWEGRLVVAYAEFGLNNFTQVGSNSNFALDGRVYRFDLGAGTSADVSPADPANLVHATLTQADRDAGQVMQRGGIGGIAVDRQRPGVMVASSFHRHDDGTEEVVWYTNDYGQNWNVVHSEVVGIRDYRGVGYVDRDKGWGAAVHWAFNIQINPYDSDMALMTTGNGFWMTKNLRVADQPITPQNQVVWGFWNDGFEETVIWNLYSPSQTHDYMISTFADWGSMSWEKDYTKSPENSTVNAESPANRIKYLDPAFDADGNPRYDLDGQGSLQRAVKPGVFERWINTQNLDYAGLKQNVMVLTPTGNYQNTNISAGVISFDEGKTATPLAVPSGIVGQGPTAQNSSGWISIDASASTVVWSVGSQAIANTYWTDVSAGADSAAVGSHVGRPQGSSEVRVVAKNGDRGAWTRSSFFNAAGNPVTTGNVKLFSDKLQPDLFYGFSGATFYVSDDGGRNFRAVTLASGTVPNTNWNTSGHSQGVNKIQVDSFRTRSIYLAPNTVAAGLVRLTYDETTASWSAAKVNPQTDSSFQQVGMGLGAGDGSVPALYAMGVISDNSVTPAASARYGMYRSLDGGATWKRINDDATQFGDLRALSGDSRVFGRVYLGTGTRGIRVGEVDWIVDAGVEDVAFAAVQWHLEQAAASGALSGNVLSQVAKHVEQAAKHAAGSASGSAVVAQLDNAVRKTGSASAGLTQALEALAATFR